jgi:hypothetical protein
MKCDVMNVKGEKKLKVMVLVMKFTMNHFRLFKEEVDNHQEDQTAKAMAGESGMCKVDNWST